MALSPKSSRVRLPNGKLMQIVSDWRPWQNKASYSADDLKQQATDFKAWQVELAAMSPEQRANLHQMQDPAKLTSHRPKGKRKAVTQRPAKHGNPHDGNVST
jgi:hypothetical protein